MSFRDILPPEVLERIDAARAAEVSIRAAFASLSDDSLVASARFWVAHCEAPRRFAPEEPVYDSTFWHAILPELIARIERRSDSRINELNNLSP